MPEIVTREEWRHRRLELLDAEKEMSRQRDRLAERRRALGWVPVPEPYAFDTHSGRQTLSDLFGDQSQLLVYHFMMGPDWEEGCPSCSFWADTYEGLDIHLRARDVAFTCVSRAPLAAIDRYRTRMGWTFPWVSSEPSDFNVDFGVSFPDGHGEYNYRTSDVGEEAPGLSAFVKHDDRVFHTYSTYARGLDPLNGAYQLLDLAPRGRDESELAWPMAWLRRHDQY